MNPDNSNSTLQRIWFDQGFLNALIAERENSFLCSLI